MHGKIPEVENLEDVLTSNVFGLVKNIPNSHCLFHILRKATDYHDGSDLIDNVERRFGVDITEYSHSEYVFWPTHRIYGEPDLILILKSDEASNPDLILCIEVKYHSKKSGIGDNDQLRRYFDSLRDESNRNHYLNRSIRFFRGKFIGIIYVTNRTQKREVDESIKMLEQDGDDHDYGEMFFRLKWSDITKVFKNMKVQQSEYKKTFEDIYNFLIYKDLKEFEGIPTVPKDLVLDHGSSILYESDHMGFPGISTVPKEIQSMVENNKECITYKGELNG